MPKEKDQKEQESINNMNAIIKELKENVHVPKQEMEYFELFYSDLEEIDYLSKIIIVISSYYADNNISNDLKKVMTLEVSKEDIKNTTSKEMFINGVDFAINSIEVDEYEDEDINSNNYSRKLS